MLPTLTPSARFRGASALEEKGWGVPTYELKDWFPLHLGGACPWGVLTAPRHPSPQSTCHVQLLQVTRAVPLHASVGAYESHISAFRTPS